MSLGVFGYHLLLRTENWKHCSEIIFKCVNSAVRPIFNESFAEKKKFVALVNSAQDPLEKHKFCWNALL